MDLYGFFGLQLIGASASTSLLGISDIRFFNKSLIALKP